MARSASPARAAAPVRSSTPADQAINLRLLMTTSPLLFAHPGHVTGSIIRSADPQVPGAERRRAGSAAGMMKTMPTTPGDRPGPAAVIGRPHGPVGHQIGP